MTVAMGKRRECRWLRSALAVWMVLGTLGSLLPVGSSRAEPVNGGAIDQLVNPCRAPVALTLEYDDYSNGFGLKYPAGWIWRPRSDAVPGTRSDTVWFGPQMLVGVPEPNCITTTRLTMHYFLTDTSLEDMRDSTLAFGSLLSRAFQGETVANTAVVAPRPPVPSARLPQFWGRLSRNNLWGAERLTLPTGQPYYREIGTGAVQDLQLRERPGSIVRYVIAVNPRVMLEVIGEATTPEFEAQYGQVFDQMVQTLGISPVVSPNPGPIGASAGPGDCQAMVLVYDDRDDKPFLERTAVVQELRLAGAAVAVNPDDPDASCGPPIQRVALFLDTPIEADTPAHAVSVYGLPVNDPPQLRPGLDLSQAGYYLSWRIPKDIFGQRVVYVGAQLGDGRWSWVTRQVNIAPPISASIEVSPPTAEIGQVVTVSMRVFNNTNGPVSGVRPVLYPTEGPGAVILQSGPVVRSGGCNLDAAPTAAAAAPTAVTSGAGGAAAGGGGAAAEAPSRGPVEVQLAPYGTGTSNCAAFVWTFTAMRSGALSFSGTAEGRLDELALRLLSRTEPPARAMGQDQAPGPGEPVTAPITSAADVEVRPIELRVPRDTLGVVPDYENPNRFEVWLLVSNDGGAPVYNIEGRLVLQGVEGQVSPIEAQGQLVDGAVLRGDRGCPAVPRAAGRRNPNFVAGNAAAFLLPTQCVAFVRAFEVPSGAATQPFTVQIRVTSSTAHSATQDTTSSITRVVYPELALQSDPLTLATIQDLLTLRGVRVVNLLLPPVGSGAPPLPGASGVGVPAGGGVLSPQGNPLVGPGVGTGTAPQAPATNPPRPSLLGPGAGYVPPAEMVDDQASNQTTSTAAPNARPAGTGSAGAAGATGAGGVTTTGGTAAGATGATTTGAAAAGARAGTTAAGTTATGTSTGATAAAPAGSTSTGAGTTGAGTTATGTSTGATGVAPSGTTSTGTTGASSPTGAGGAMTGTGTGGTTTGTSGGTTGGGGRVPSVTGAGSAAGAAIGAGGSAGTGVGSQSSNAPAAAPSGNGAGGGGASGGFVPLGLAESITVSQTAPAGGYTPAGGPTGQTGTTGAQAPEGAAPAPPVPTGPAANPTGGGVVQLGEGPAQGAPAAPGAPGGPPTITVAPGGVLPDCQSDPTRVLFICIRLTPLIGGQPNPDSRVFAVGDTLRVTMEIRNFGDVPLVNVQPGPVSLRGSTEAEDPDAVSRAFGDPSQAGQAASAAAAQAAASAAARGQSPAGAAAAAQTAAQGVQAAASATGTLGGVGGTACGLTQTSNINRTQLLRGPNPVSIDRLPPTPPNGPPAIITWDFLVDQQLTGDLAARAGRERFRTQQGDLGSAGATAVNPADGTLLLSGIVASDPLEKAIQCVFPTLVAEPSIIQEGDEFTVMMRVLNSNAFYQPRRWTDLIPSALRQYFENTSPDFQLTLLSGPSNPVTSAPVNLGESEVTYFTWRYRATGTGCVHLRGRMLGRAPQGTQIGASPFDLLSNTVDSGLICVVGRARLQSLSGEHPPASPPAQVPPPPLPVTGQSAFCEVPRQEAQRPEPAAELRLVRDAQGNYWQIQSGCRHSVVPFAMDTATLNRIPAGEDVSFLTFGFAATPSPPAPLGYPSYADIPDWLLPESTTPPPGPVAPAPPPGVLTGYANRVLAFDPADPGVVYLLDGGARHRVLLFYPLDVPASAIDPSRAGDPAAYRLRRSADQAALLIQQGVPPEIATFIRSISEVPLGAAAPYYGWGPGETVVIADRPVAPIARPCIPPTVDRGGFVNDQDAARLRNVERLPECSARWRDSQRITPGDYVKDPDNFAGRDVRLVGVACNVRYNRGRGVTTMTITDIPAVAPGRFARIDPRLTDGARVFAAAATGSGEVAAGSELVIFEYLAVGGGGVCVTPTGR